MVVPIIGPLLRENLLYMLLVLKRKKILEVEILVRLLLNCLILVDDTDNTVDDSKNY